MRKLILPLMASLALSAGCKEEPAETEVEKAKESAAAALKQAMKAAEAVKKEAAEKSKEVDAPKDLNEAMKNVEKAMGQVTSDVDPVSFRKLKALLPEKAGIYTRTKTSGEKGGAMGIKISHTTGKYEGPDGATATVKITDAGTMKGMAAGMAGWAMIEIERESDDGFERTFKHEGHKAHEKFTNKGQRGEYHVFVADRFIVEVRGRKAPMEKLKALFEAIDVGDLDDMKSEGVKEAKK